MAEIENQEINLLNSVLSQQTFGSFCTDNLPVCQIWRDQELLQCLGSSRRIFIILSPALCSGDWPVWTTSVVPLSSEFWVSFSNKEPWHQVVGGRWMMMVYLFPQSLSWRSCNVGCISKDNVERSSPWNYLPFLWFSTCLSRASVGGSCLLCSTSTFYALPSPSSHLLNPSAMTCLEWVICFLPWPELMGWWW